MSLSPLESFIRDYAESAAGAWEEVEPQVYDLLLPGDAAGEQVMVRVTFDPEAVPEHPGSQLASYGTPLVDRLLADAQTRGRFAQFYFLGLNLAPHDLSTRVRRAVHLEESAELRIDRQRTLDFPQAFFWFQCNFVSDQKEDDILSVAVDLHYGRQVRHHEKLLDSSRLSLQPALPLPEVDHAGLASALPLARNEAMHTLTTLAHTRMRELHERLDRQVRRMKQYYGDLRRELAAPVRGRDSDDARARREQRLQAIEREERLRIAELRQKNSLRVSIRLLSLLEIYQPKFLIHCTLSMPKRSAANFEVVWDPLQEAVEALPCPACHRPTFNLRLARDGGLHCGCRGAT